MSRQATGACGLVAGMRFADARALYPTLPQLKIIIPLGDHADLHHLALWARRGSPLTAIDHDLAEYGLILLGLEHLFGGCG